MLARCIIQIACRWVQQVMRCVHKPSGNGGRSVRSQANIHTHARTRRDCSSILTGDERCVQTPRPMCMPIKTGDINAFAPVGVNRRSTGTDTGAVALRRRTWPPSSHGSDQSSLVWSLTLTLAEPQPNRPAAAAG